MIEITLVNDDVGTKTSGHDDGRKERKMSEKRAKGGVKYPPRWPVH